LFFLLRGESAVLFFQLNEATPLLRVRQEGSALVSEIFSVAPYKRKRREYYHFPGRDTSAKRRRRVSEITCDPAFLLHLPCTAHRSARTDGTGSGSALTTRPALVSGHEPRHQLASLLQRRLHGARARASPSSPHHRRGRDGRACFGQNASAVRVVTTPTANRPAP